MATKTIYISYQGNDMNDGSTPALAFKTLRGALAAVSGNEVESPTTRAYTFATSTVLNIYMDNVGLINVDRTIVLNGPNSLTVNFIGRGVNIFRLIGIESAMFNMRAGGSGNAVLNMAFTNMILINDLGISGSGTLLLASNITSPCNDSARLEITNCSIQNFFVTLQTSATVGGSMTAAASVKYNAFRCAGYEITDCYLIHSPNPNSVIKWAIGDGNVAGIVRKGFVLTADTDIVAGKGAALPAPSYAPAMPPTIEGWEDDFSYLLGRALFAQDRVYVADGDKTCRVVSPVWFFPNGIVSNARFVQVFGEDANNVVDSDPTSPTPKTIEYRASDTFFTNGNGTGPTLNIQNQIYTFGGSIPSNANLEFAVAPVIAGVEGFLSADSITPDFSDPSNAQRVILAWDVQPGATGYEVYSRINGSSWGHVGTAATNNLEITTSSHNMTKTPQQVVAGPGWSTVARDTFTTPISGKYLQFRVTLHQI